MAKDSQGNSRLESTDKSYFQEYLQCLCFFALLFVVIAVASFDPSDPSPFNVAAVSAGNSEALTNLFGPLGAALADWSFQVLGVGALVFSFVFLAQILSSFRRPRKKSRWLLRSFGYPQLIVCYLGLVSGLAPAWTYKGVAFHSGGIIGHSVFVFFVSIFGSTGAKIALAFGVAASLPLCLGVRPVTLITRLLAFIPFARAQKLASELLLGNGAASNAGAVHAGAALARGDLAFAGVRQPDSGSPGALLPRHQLASKAAALLARRRAESGADSSHDNINGTINGSIADSTGGSAGSEDAREGVALVASARVVRVNSDDGLQPAHRRDVLPPALRDEGRERKVLSAAEFSELVLMLEPPGKPAAKKDPEQESLRLKQEAILLEEKMATFGVLGVVTRSQPGPVVNVHEFEPAAGIKVTKVMSLQDDLALGLKAQSILMAPQPGKSTIGIEVPAQLREVVSLRDVMESPAFRNNGTPLPMALGKLVDGSPLVADLSGMPHLLVAGSTGSGKSVGINVMLLSLMMSRTPDQLRLILVDPKMLELSNYDGIGHLLMPVVTEPAKAAGALKWAIDEMERRYKLMKLMQVRNISGYNGALEAGEVPPEQSSAALGLDFVHKPLPYIVVVIDELCDLMMTAPKDVEDSIQRLAQKARAAGIHLILATQRPSVDVLTGVIKANLPCRLSFQVASKHDSRTIIETIGAEKLLGKGDMLFLPPGTSKLVRSHCAYVGDKEINRIADRLRSLYPVRYESEIMEEVERVSQNLCQKNDRSGEKIDGTETDGNNMDENTLYEKSVEFALISGQVSTSSIQRHFRIGYNRAARLMDRMVKEGLVGPSDVAGKPRQVIGSTR